VAAEVVIARALLAAVPLPTVDGTLAEEPEVVFGTVLRPVAVDRGALVRGIVHGTVSRLVGATCIRELVACAAGARAPPVTVAERVRVSPGAAARLVREPKVVDCVRVRVDAVAMWEEGAALVAVPRAPEVVDASFFWEARSVTDLDVVILVVVWCEPANLSVLTCDATVAGREGGLLLAVFKATAPGLEDALGGLVDELGAREATLTGRGLIAPAADVERGMGRAAVEGFSVGFRAAARALRM
jgi:hypothetical protein